MLTLLQMFTLFFPPWGVQEVVSLQNECYINLVIKEAHFFPGDYLSMPLCGACVCVWERECEWFSSSERRQQLLLGSLSRRAAPALRGFNQTQILTETREGAEANPCRRQTSLGDPVLQRPQAPGGEQRRPQAPAAAHPFSSQFSGRIFHRSSSF